MTLGISPEMVLGKPVMTDEGRKVGEVVDVGVHDLKRVKFLVVEGDAGARPQLVRLGVDRIASVGSEAVILKDR